MKINFNFEEKNVKLGLENQFTIQEFLETTAVKILMLKGEKGDTVSAEWGTITGDIADQTDLASALDTKADTTDIPDVSHFITKDVDNLTNYTDTTTLNNALNGKADIEDIPDVSSFITKDVNNLTNYTKTSDLSTVAISGDYDDLDNKPTIPSKTSDLTNDSNFAVTNADNKFSVGQTIAGETVVDSIRTKNMFDKSTTVQQNREGTNSTGRLSTRQVLWLEAGTYTFSTNMPSTFNYGLATYPNLLPNTDNLIYDSGWQSASTFTFTLSTASYFGVNFRKADNSNLTVNDISSYNFQLEKSSTATASTPYQNLEGNNTLNAIWSGNLYTTNTTTNIGKNLEKNKLYVFEVKGLSSVYYEYIPFVANGGTQSVQHTTYDGSTAVRWRIIIENATFKLDTNSLNMSANTAIVNLYKLS